MRYRADIDGLRAIAVLAVVYFHVFNAGFRGAGYLGVDVFFVISGFLITQIVLGQLRGESFSYFIFMRRRVVRLGPALWVVSAATLFAGLLLGGDDLVKLAKAAAYSATFTLNLSGFWEGFRPFFQNNPLLPTWSLGVEMQFYLLWPLLLMGLHKRRGMLLFAVCALCIASFIGSSFAVRSMNIIDYTQLPFRLYQFGLGSLAALIGLRWQSKGDVSENLISIVGFALILAGLVFARDLYDTARPYWALLACSGAAAMLVVQGDGFAARVLSLKPLVYVGKNSYALYLTHYPILHFVRGVSDGPMSLAEQWLVVLLSFVSAAAIHHLVERPSGARKWS